MPALFHWLVEGALSGLWKAAFLILLAGGSLSSLFGGVTKFWKWSHTPEFEILPKIQVSENNYYRILVRNNSKKTLKIGARLVELDPPAEKATANFPLQLAGHPGQSEADVPPRTTQPFDVFKTLGPDEGLIVLQGVNNYPEITKVRYRFRLAAYVTAGSSVERTFELDPKLRVVNFEAVDK